jgi:ABC-type glycerol-3-phosphate transport system permease component
VSGAASRRPGRLAARAAAVALLAVIGLLWLTPFLWMLATSFKPSPEIYRVPLRWIPDHPTLSQYTGSWKAAPFERYYLNSIVVATVTTALVSASASMCGFALARLWFRGRLFILGGILSSTMIPFQVLLIPFFILMTELRLVNSRGGLILPYLAVFLPFAVFMFRGFFMSLPHEIEESARMDGCSWLAVYARIALPLSRPAVATVAIYTFMESWNEFFIALIMTSKTAMRTLPLGLAVFRSDAVGVNWGQLMAASVLACVPVIAVFLVLQRQFIAGLTGGALKG